MRPRVRRAALALLAAWMGAHLLLSLVLVASTVTTVVQLSGGGEATRPFESLTFRALWLQSWASLLALPAFVAVGFASWRDPAAWRRFLVAFGIVDVYLALHMFDAVRPDLFGSAPAFYVLWRLEATLLSAAGVALCWGARQSRGLALGGAALLAAHTLASWTMNGVFGPAPLPNVEGALAAFLVGTLSLNAAGLALFAWALASAAGPWRAPRDPPSDPHAARTL